MKDTTLDPRYATFPAFQQDFLQHLEAKLGVKVEITAAKAWFELGMLYQEMNLAEENDEVAAIKLVEAVMKMLH